MSREKNLYNNFIEDFTKVICQQTAGKEYSNIIFLCIGTDKVIGDSFGPLVGYKLDILFKSTNRIKIIGNLSEPVCCNNIDSVLNNINEQFRNPFIVAIDSALSIVSDNIGRITVSDGGLCIGSGLDKNNVHIGDMNIKGIVGRDTRKPIQNFRILQNTSLNLVMRLADTVSKGIYRTINFK